MQERPESNTGNFILFLVLSLAILFGYQALFNPPKERPRAPQQELADKGLKKQEPEAEAGKQPPEVGEAPPKEQPEPDEGPEEAAPDAPAPGPEIGEQKVPRQWLTLGSADDDSPYRMLVTLTNQGAAVARIELNSPRYRDLDRHAYLGLLGESLIDSAAGDTGCRVQVVGPGTPAFDAGLAPGDVILEIAEQPVNTAAELQAVLDKTKPGTVTLVIRRKGEDKDEPLEVTLGRRPSAVVRPENDDPLSFRLTLQHVQGNGIQEQTLEKPQQLVEVGEEIPGLDLWTGNWEVMQDECNQTRAKFRKRLPKLGLEITKTYALVEVPTESQKDANFKAYHLIFDVEIRNTSGQNRKVAYQLDGPTGLLVEGEWYAYKSGPDWGTAGLRDVVVSFNRRFPSWVYCTDIAEAEADFDTQWESESLSFIGVDAQYFSCLLLPQKESSDEIWFEELYPLLVGEVKKRKTETNTSCRMISKVADLAPGGKLSRSFEIFAGPKKPDILTPYQLNDLVYYGWFGAISKPLGAILHVFAMVGNYGVAILLLTVLVRGCMFPLSRKQALGAQKMQELQPEIKRIQQKYKNDMEGRTKAQQDLFRKHNYNPLSGCLVLFFQLPIFIALYRLLSVDIELRQAPLIHESVRWCSNLAAPDMLFDWRAVMPEFVVGWSPYFNLLPIFTIALFIMQQKMFMPPPTDDQQAMQQKIMKYMMIFFGFMFFKVASGLCVYFIASSLWGLAERKFLPKHTPPAAAVAASRSRAEAKAEARSQAKPKSKPAAAGRDGAADAKKKKDKRPGGKR